MENNYKFQVQLILEALPIVMKDKSWALKGGTAINLFYRDAPRLSVDIDLCYLPIEDRNTSFQNIHSILKEAKRHLEKHGFTVQSSHPLDGKSEVKLFVESNRVQIKIEPNFVFRGSIFKPELKNLSMSVINEFGKETEVNCLSFPDLFGGKTCAALDRQHPRDLFDIKYLLENEGVTEDIRKSFIVYLISHSRPINEVLSPNLKDISTDFVEEFKGMTKIDISIDELKDARELLIKNIKEGLTVNEKNFLVSFKPLAPDWSLLGLEGVEKLPAVQWKILNLQKLKDKNSRKYREQLEKLKGKL